MVLSVSLKVQADYLLKLEWEEKIVNIEVITDVVMQWDQLKKVLNKYTLLAW